MPVNPNIFTDLIARYDEPIRYYHDLNHIISMLNTAKDLAYPLSEIQTLAIWFHDIVYDPKSDKNEEDSVILAEEMLSHEGYSDYAIGTISQIIMDTKFMRPSIKDSEIILDLDVFGFATDMHDHNHMMIRNEYSHVPYREWHEGRAKFLEKFLESKRNTNNGDIFYSECLKGTCYDIKALKNITKEIETSMTLVMEYDMHLEDREIEKVNLALETSSPYLQVCHNNEDLPIDDPSQSL